MGIENWKSNGSEKESEIKHWFDVYDKVYDHLNQSHDHYFKRTQILMFAIQFGLATAFVKLFITESLLKYEQYVALFLISILAMVFCFIWFSMIQRHWEVLEYCRCYMRYIEGHLMELGVPLAVFRTESAIFYHRHRVIFGNKESCKNCKNKSCQEKYPYEDKEVKIGLLRLEKNITLIIGLVWSGCFSIFLYKTLKNYDSKILELISYACLAVTIIILSVYMIVELRKRLKEKKEDSWAWIRFASFLLLFCIFVWTLDYCRSKLPEFLSFTSFIISIIYTISKWEKDNRKNIENQPILFEELKEIYSDVEKRIRFEWF